MFHYTDKKAWNAIRSQITWEFKAFQPKHPDRPVGAYFTVLEPSDVNLRLLYKKIRVPKEKQTHIFRYTGTDGLTQLNNGTGRDKYIFYSAANYLVAPERQEYCGLTKGADGGEK